MKYLLNVIQKDIGFSKYVFSTIFSLRQGFASESHVKATVKKVVDTLIKSDRVVIFSKTECSQCEDAKRFFDDIKHPYTAIEIDRREDGPYILAHLGVITSSLDVPRIFIIGKCIGGTYELKKMHESGDLLKLLKKR